MANVCLYCNEPLKSPSICKFCGFKFCQEHETTASHQCIKTRYFEYIKKTKNPPNISNGKFRVVCNTCGYTSKKATPIEYAGEELVQHTQMIGCSKDLFLEEVDENRTEVNQIKINPQESENIRPIPVTREDEDSIVEQLVKISSLKEKDMISEDEFEFIKRELIKKLK